MTLDGFLAQAGQILSESGRVFRLRQHDRLRDGRAGRPAADDPGRRAPGRAQRRSPPGEPLRRRRRRREQARHPEPGPASWSAALLADEYLCGSRFRAIRHYARRPTFDRRLHSSAAPAGTRPRASWSTARRSCRRSHEPAAAPDARALDRLPPRLRGLLREFSWRSDADLVNAVAMLLTGLLINHFIDDPHPGAIVDANQPGIGKTLLVQVIGRILDGTEPPRIPLEQRRGAGEAALRPGPQLAREPVLPRQRPGPDRVGRPRAEHALARAELPHPGQVGHDRAAELRTSG